MICSKCKKDLELNEINFQKRKTSRTGFRNQCRKCFKEVYRRYDHSHKEKRSEKNKKYRKGHIEKIKWLKKIWGLKNKKRIHDTFKLWERKNRKRLNKYRREYNKSHIETVRIIRRRANKKLKVTNINYRIKMNLYRRMNLALRETNSVRICRFVDFIGCSGADLKAHLESKFQQGMTWFNYGNGDHKWQIDHIRPCYSYDLKDPDQQKACFNFKNLQPLWKKDNLEKGKKYGGVINE